MPTFPFGIQLGIGKLLVFAANIRLYDVLQIDVCIGVFLLIFSIIHNIVYIVLDKTSCRANLL